MQTCIQILNEKTSPCLEKLGKRGISQHNNNTKQIAKIIQDFFFKKKGKTTTWPGMSVDLNPREHLWRIIKLKVEQQNPSRQKVAKKNQV